MITLFGERDIKISISDNSDPSNLSAYTSGFCESRKTNLEIFQGPSGPSEYLYFEKLQQYFAVAQPKCPYGAWTEKKMTASI